MNPSAPPAHSRKVARSYVNAAAPELVNRRDIIAGVEPIVTAPAFFGPPVVFLLGPWLLLVLLLIGPAALLITLVLAFVVVAGALVALAALLASPYLVVHHLRSHHRASHKRFAFLRRHAAVLWIQPYNRKVQT